jgi:PAS domain S-box-containing protein
MNPTDEQLRVTMQYLLHTDSNFAQLFRLSGDALFVLHKDTMAIAAANPRATDLTGYSTTEMVGMNFPVAGSLPDEVTGQQITQALRTAANGGDSKQEVSLVHSTGHLHWVLLQVQPAILGGMACLLAACTCIDDRMATLRHLRENENRLRQTMDCMLEGAQIIGYNWQYLYVNNAVVQQARLTREELMGNTMIACFPGIEYSPAFALFERCMTERVPCQIENEFTYPNGDTNWFELRIEPVPEGIFILSVDIQERKTAEQGAARINEMLEEKVAERTQELATLNKTLETFSYSVAHDLRSPLRAIDGYAQLLEKDYAATLDGEGNRFLTVIRHSTQRMGKLIDDVLHFAKAGKTILNKEKVNMQQLLQQVWDDQLLLGPNTAVLKMNELPPAMADKALIRQVWENLVANALKYSSGQAQPVVHITAEASSTEVVYSVTDNGTGFDMKYADKLFTVFQRLHRQAEFSGSGVGLAIADSIVSRHGGRIWAQSSPGQGATFYFTLPLT